MVIIEFFMNMKKVIILFGSLVLLISVATLIFNPSSKNDIFDSNVEALASDEGESINCIPDENSVCVDSSYGVVQPKHYFSQH